MKIADFEQIMLALTHDGPSGHLALLDAPTGSGKSYTIVHFYVTKLVRMPIFAHSLSRIRRRISIFRPSRQHGSN